MYTVINNSELAPPQLTTTLAFQVKHDGKPLLVKYVPGELYQKFVLLLLKAIASDTFDEPR